jgi:hypothetical protein
MIEMIYTSLYECVTSSSYVRALMPDINTSDVISCDDIIGSPFRKRQYATIVAETS